MTALAQTLVRRDVRGGLLTDVMLVVLGSLVVAGFAQLSLRLPFTPVPITGQTLAVLLVGASLGSVRGGSALLLYLGEGAAGLPFFAEGRSGAAYLTTADPLHVSGGYLWGFVVAAVVVGFLAERGWDRSIKTAISAMLLGEVAIYLLGIPWLAAAINVPVHAAGEQLNDALEFGLYPFVLGDLLKLLIAAGALPVAWRFVGDTRGLTR